MTELCFKDAVDLARMIRDKEVSASEVMTAFLSQIERVNPKVNAVCSFIGEEAALNAAKKADEKLTKGEPVGPLHGLPHAVKDLALTEGIRTTFGSRIYKDFIPGEDTLFVERLKQAGAIVIGKTNTPEFGAGSQTFNEVFGATRNPYGLRRKQRRGGRRPRLWDAASRRRQRSRRIAQKSGQLLQRRWFSPFAGPSPFTSRDAGLEHALRGRPDGPYGPGRRAAAFCDGGT
jgi:hypothetical protein